MLNSLRFQLLCWLMVPLAGVVLFNIWTTHSSAMATANLVNDRTLLASARVIAEQVKEVDGVIEALIPPSALELFASEDRDRILYRVIAPNGSLLAGYPDVAVPPREPEGLQPFYFDSGFRGEPIRAVALAQPVASRLPSGNALVVVARTLRGRDRLVTDLWINALRDQVLLVSLAGLLALFGLHRGLAPLLRLRNDVLKRDPQVLSILPVGSVQSELRPLVEALNEEALRMQGYAASQRRFIANASHQLRTPLALLKTQIMVGQRESAPEARQEVLNGLDNGVDAIIRLTNQLLTLARAEPGSNAIRKDIVDFAAITRAVLEKMAVVALDRQIDLSFDEGEDAGQLYGHATLLSEMVLNLVENALRYTPTGGLVIVSLRRRGETIVLCVEDNGPGIPAPEREKVFERFYRLPGTIAEGSGLGLAIVREIVLVHDGQIILDGRHPAPGLRINVLLPGMFS